MDPRINITEQEYREHKNIEASLEFYKEKYAPVAEEFQSFDDKNEEERATFRKLIMDYYTGMLETTPEELNDIFQTEYEEDGKTYTNENKYLNIISNWLFNQAFNGYLVAVENNIVNAHRDASEPSRVNLDSGIRQANRQFIKALHANNDTDIEMLKAFNQSSMPRL